MKKKHKRTKKSKGHKASKTRIRSVKSDLEKEVSRRSKKLATHPLNPPEFQRFRSKLKSEMNNFIITKALNKYRINRKSITQLLDYVESVIDRQLRHVKKTFIRKKK